MDLNLEALDPNLVLFMPFTNLFHGSSNSFVAEKIPLVTVANQHDQEYFLALAQKHTFHNS